MKNAIACTARRFIAAKAARSSAALADAQAGPTVVAGLFRTASGIGESARLCADSLERDGIDVIRCDLSSTFRQIDLPPDSRLQPFPKTHQPGTLVIHLNPPEITKGLIALGLIGKAAWRVIGYWVWELETAPHSWRQARPFVTEVWTPSQFSARAISSVIDLPVAVTPHCVKAKSVRASIPATGTIPEGAFTILTMADSRSSFDRKNVFGAIDAFCAAFGERDDGWLIVKTRNLMEDTALAEELETAAKRHPRIRIIDGSITDDEKWALLSSCDIFLSLHRSEGFGLVLAEAMSLGKPVVATGWSGIVEFAGEHAARLTPYTLTSVSDRSGLYTGHTEPRWAEPDVSAAAAALRSLTDNPAARSALGIEAQKAVRNKLNGAAYLAALRRI